MGDYAIGTITTLHYSAAIDTPVNKAFAEPFRKFAKKSASYYSEMFFTGGKWIVESANKLNGNVEDRQKFLTTLKEHKVTDDPRGPIEIDKYGNPIQNIYIRKVEKVGGELQNTVIHTYPKVSQFWKYDPEEYMKKPLYSRDYPPMKK
jgi:branched-chain amino acid transport system substrate-binding protein